MKDAYSWGQHIKDYWLLLGENRFRYSVLAILRLISSGLFFLIAYLLGFIVDFFSEYAAGDSLFSFYAAAVGIGLTGFTVTWLRFFSKVRMQNIGANLRKDVRVNAMKKLMNLELRWHESEETGSKIHRINEGGEAIFTTTRDFSNWGLHIIATIVIGVVLFVPVSFTYTAFALVYVMLYLFGEKYFNKRLIYWEDQLNKTREKVSGKLHESASNVLTVKSLGLEGSLEKSASKHEEEYYHVWLKRRAIAETKLKTIKTFSYFVLAGFVLLIGFDFIAGRISLGSILVYVAYFERLIAGCHEVSHQMQNFIRNKSGVGRFMSVFGQEVVNRDRGKVALSSSWSVLSFQNLWFSYRSSFALKDVSFTVSRGEKIGIVGESGCGKSTLAKLLLGLYEPSKGSIVVDGKNLGEYAHSSVMDEFSVVLQDSEMFNMSLKENVVLGNSGFDKPRYNLALEIAQLLPLLKKLPEGDKTLLGERGYKLSGGERQRVALARALYKDSSLLILDEATSALDSKTELKIQRALDTALDKKTLLIIAHRLSTLKSVDRIVVMDRGSVVEQGSFNELLKSRGLFFQLYQLQKKK